MINKFFLIGGGVAVAGTGAGVGIYYGVKGNNWEKPKNSVEERQTNDTGDRADGSGGDARDGDGAQDEDGAETEDEVEDPIELPAS